MMSKKSTDLAIEKVSDVNDYFCDNYDLVKKLSTNGSNAGIHCFQGTSFDGSKHFIKKCSKFYVRRSNIDNPWNEINALQIISFIKSKYFPAFIKAIEDDQYVCLISEYVDGDELFSKIEQNPGGLEPKKAQRYLIQISHAIRELHDHNIAHLDLSSENVIIDKNDNIKLIDYGVCSKIIDDSKNDEKCNHNYNDSDQDIDEKKKEEHLTYNKHIRSHVLPGKDGYRAPEIECRTECDPKLADAFSFGYMAWTVLCGNMPFETAHPHNEIYAKFMEYGAGKWREMLCKSMNGWNDRTHRFVENEIPENAIQMLDDLLQCNTHKRKYIEELLDDGKSFLRNEIEEKKSDIGEYKMSTHYKHRTQV